jgi:hypothetical protein
LRETRLQVVIRRRQRVITGSHRVRDDPPEEIGRRHVDRARSPRVSCGSWRVLTALRLVSSGSQRVLRASGTVLTARHATWAEPHAVIIGRRRVGSGPRLVRIDAHGLSFERPRLRTGVHGAKSGAVVVIGARPSERSGHDAVRSSGRRPGRDPHAT